MTEGGVYKNDSISKEIRRTIIASGRDLYQKNNIYSSPGAHIGSKFGLDEEETALLVGKILANIQSDEYALAALNYFKALQEYRIDPYKQLWSFASDKNRNITWVPDVTQLVDESGIVYKLKDAIHKCTQQDCTLILIEGDPGAGKSTLLSFVTKCAWDNPAEIGLDKRYIALPLKARALAAANKLTREDQIWAALELGSSLHMSGTRPPKNFMAIWADQLGANWLILIDGLDEVPESSKDHVDSWINNLRKDYIVVLTYRPDIIKKFSVEVGTATYRIKNLAEPDRHLFATYLLGDSAEEFLKQLESIDDDTLSATPLVMLIAISAYLQSGALPRRRSLLYHEFICGLINESIAKPQVEELGTELAELAQDIIPIVLQKIAFIMTSQRADYSQLKVFSNIENFIEPIAKLFVEQVGLGKLVAIVRARAILAFIESRINILSFGGTNAGWAHSTFREYLTAKFLAEQQDTSEIIKTLEKISDANWRQVVLFYLLIRSEQDSVTNHLQHIHEIHGTEGLVFVALALRNGARSEPEYLQFIFDELSLQLYENAQSHTCGRLLSLSSAVAEQTPDLIAWFIGLLPFQKFVPVIGDRLSEIAVSFGRRGSSAVKDLGRLRAVETLLTLANSESVPASVSIDSASELVNVASVDIAAHAFINIAMRKDLTPAVWTEFSRSLVYTNSNELIVNVFSEISPPALVYEEVLNSHNPETVTDIIDEIIACKPIKVEVREYFLRRKELYSKKSFHSATQNIDKLQIADQRKNFLTSLKSGELIIKAIEKLCPVRLRGQILKELIHREANEQIFLLLQQASIPYVTKRRCAEYLYANSDDINVITELQSFFSSLSIANRLRIYRRRIAIAYRLNQNDIAINLIKDFISRYSETATEMMMLALCYERINDNEGAAECYKKVLDNDPSHINAMCGLAFIQSQTGDYYLASKTMADIVSLPSFAPEWFRIVGGDILRNVNKLEEAEIWLTKTEENEKSYYLEKACLSIDAGRLYAGIHYFNRLEILDPNEVTCVREAANAYRIFGMMDEAQEEYKRALSIDSGDLEAKDQLAGVLLRKGSINEAKIIIADVNSEYGGDPYLRYLESILEYVEGDDTALLNGATVALSNTNELSLSWDERERQLSNRFIYKLIIGVSEKISELDELFENCRFHQLRHHTIPELSLVCQIMRDRPDIKSIYSDIFKRLWPEGLDLRQQGAVGRERLRSIRRSDYPFPMYCSQPSIGGLYEDETLAKRILSDVDASIKTLVIWRLDGRERLYGQCNFKNGSDMEFNLKFCDAQMVILRTNLVAFRKRLGLRRILFLEEDLLEDFRTTAEALGLHFEFELIGPDCY